MAVTKYIYDGDTVLQETDGAGVTQKEYTSTAEGFGDLLSAYDGSAAKYFEPDALGSTDALSDSTQAVTDRWKYQAFGAAVHTTGSDTTPYTWVGRHSYFGDSETGLRLMGSGTRYYATDSIQFMSCDPIGLGAGDPNTRRYANNNPANHIDPSGLASIEQCNKAKSKLSDLKWFKEYSGRMARRGCEMPTILCVEGGDGKTAGIYDNKRKEARIFVNANNEVTLLMTMIHELIHALDYCNKLRSLVTRQPLARACSELRAYLYSGACYNLEGYRKFHESISDCLLRQASASIEEDLPNNLNPPELYVCCIWELCLTCSVPSLSPGSYKPLPNSLPKPSACATVGGSCKDVLAEETPGQFVNWLLR